ncbi:MAG: gamma-glutamylcyclotransferase [Alphaproteobacteria bacterium]|nr:gamma-glutamylcyclotransferase [Alphaproteobacteria bacterium]
MGSKGPQMYQSDELPSFTYGSNMSSRYLRTTCPSARPMMSAMLPNVRIEFRRYSTDLGGGISTIMPAPGEMVHGVLYRIARAEIEALDLLEDVDKGLYLRESHLVLGADDDWHRGELYRVAKPEGPFAPSRTYLDHMLEGAREHGLPADYVARLEALRQ